jgi:hypothetical protein
MLPPFPPEGDGGVGADEVHPDANWYVRWRPALVSAAVFATVVAAIVLTRDGDSVTDAGTTTTTVSATTVPQGDVSLAPITEIVKRGDRGEDVRRIQQRLKDLRFDPGPIDGVFGGDTAMAVWAFQKLVMKYQRDEIVDLVTPEMWDIMRQDVEVLPRRPGAQTATHVEIYLPEQAMVVFKDRVPILMTHMSSGDGQEWCEEVTIDPGEDGNRNGKEPITKGVCGVSWTPGGIYYFYRRVSGTRESQLGSMWNPVYFNYGIAVHGAMQVPEYPASHGCIRIPIFISEYFPAMVNYGDRVYVFDGVKEPEDYGSPPPIFNKDDPNYTTTTSTSTTTTTLPRTTTTRPAPTTTTVPPSPAGE